jgi:hypothetical protein
MIDDLALIDALNRWGLHQHQRINERRYRRVEVVGDIPQVLKNRLQFEIERLPKWPIPSAECGDEARAFVLAHARPGRTPDKFEYEIRVVEEFGE